MSETSGLINTALSTIDIDCLLTDLSVARNITDELRAASLISNDASRFFFDFHDEALSFFGNNGLNLSSDLGQFFFNSPYIHPDFSQTQTDVAAVPLPAGLPIFLTGLGGLVLNA